MTTDIIILTAALAAGLLCALLGAALASGNGRRRAGFWLGGFLGPVGIIIALLLKPAATAPAARPPRPQTAKRCPLCGKLCALQDLRCPECGADLPRVQLPPQPTTRKETP